MTKPLEYFQVNCAGTLNVLNVSSQYVNYFLLASHI